MNTDDAKNGGRGFACSVLKVVAALVILCFAGFLAISLLNPSVRRNVRGDFPQFVVAARLLHDAPEQLYDLELQHRQFEAMTGKQGRMPYLYPPFVAAIFRPITSGPFLAGFLVWMAISVLLYACAVRLSAPADQRSLAVWLAWASPLFLWYTLCFAQLSAVACAAVAASIHFERRGREFTSGMVAGLCLYKPTLLLWVFPMLLATRRYRAALGMMATGAALGAVSVAVAGSHPCLSWLRTLFGWADHVTIQRVEYPVWKYVDLNAAVKAISARPSAATAALAAAMALCAAGATLYTWRRGRLETRWAATLGLTLLVNIYGPMYDALLVVVAMLLVWDIEKPEIRLVFIVAVNVAAWVSETLAERGWPPLITFVVFAFVLRQYGLARRDWLGSPDRAAVAAAQGGG